MFTIYSIGDSAFLEQVLIALRMLTELGDFAAMVKLGLLMGVLIVFLTSLMKGAKEIDFQHVFLGFLIFWVCFFPRTDVIIEDRYTGELKPVADVPLGPAFAGSMVSTIAIRLTEMFEVAYSPVIPRMSNTQFAESLHMIHSLRSGATKDGIWLALNNAAGGGYVDLRRSWYNYLKECTYRKIELGEMQPGELRTLPFRQAVQFPSQLFGTLVYTEPGSASGQLLTCADAYTQLNARMMPNTTTGEQGLNAVIGLSDTGTGIGAGTMAKVNDAVGSLMNATVAAQEFVTMALIEPIIKEAEAGKYTEAQDITNALMINQAIAQRNTQWASEQTMFMTIVRPMIAFFEAFIYSIMPIMAFALALGSKGMQLAAKYFATLVWIQLWLPLLSIINLYIYTAATRNISSYANVEGFNWDSFYALSTVGQQAETWLATGGLLASMTPALALMLVYGSSVTATQLAGRMKSDKFIDESISSPSAVKNGPVINTASMFQGDSFTGLQRTGAGDSDFKLNLGQDTRAERSSALRTQLEATSGLQAGLRNDLVDGKNDNFSISKLSSLGRSTESLSGESKTMFNNAMNDVREAYGSEYANSNAVKGVVAATLAGGVGGNLGANIEKAFRQEKFGSSGTANSEKSSTGQSTSTFDSSGTNTSTITNSNSGQSGTPVTSDVDSAGTRNERRSGSSTESSNSTSRGEKATNSSGNSVRGGFSVKGEVTGSISGSNETSMGSSSRASEEIGKSKAFQLGEGKQLAFSEGLSAVLNDSKNHTTGSVWANTNTLSAARSVSSAASKVDAYEDVSRYSQSTGVDQSIAAGDAAFNLANSRQFGNSVSEFGTATMTNPALKNAFNDALPMGERMFGRGDKAQAWAMYRALTSDTGYSNDDQRVSNLEMATRFLATTMPGAVGTRRDAGEGVGIDGGLGGASANQGMPVTPRPLQEDPVIGQVTMPTTRPSQTAPPREDLDGDYETKRPAIRADYTNNATTFDKDAGQKQAAFDRDALAEKGADYVARHKAGMAFDAPAMATIMGVAENAKESSSALLNTYSRVASARSEATDASYDGNMAKIATMSPEQADAYVDGLKKTFGNVPEFQALQQDASASGLSLGSYVQAMFHGGPEGMSTERLAGHIQTLKAIAATEGEQAAKATNAALQDEEYSAKLAEARSLGLEGTNAEMYAQSFVTNSGQLSEYVSNATTAAGNYFSGSTSAADYHPTKMLNAMFESSVPTAGFTRALNESKIEALEAQGLTVDRQTGMGMDANGNQFQAFEMRTNEYGQQQIVLKDEQLEELTNLNAKQMEAGSTLGSNGSGFFNDALQIQALTRGARGRDK